MNTAVELETLLITNNSTFGIKVKNTLNVPVVWRIPTLEKFVVSMLFFTFSIRGQHLVVAQRL